MLFCPGCDRPFVCTCPRLEPQPTELKAGLTLWNLGPHQGALAELIHRLKYGDETRIASYFGARLAALPCGFADVDALVPIPLHAERVAERGYNQSALLARAVGRKARIRTRTDLIERAVATSQQVRLSASARATNVRHAFHAGSRARGLRLALVDDVVTTGHTLSNVADELGRAGAEIRFALSISVAPPKLQ